MVCRPTTASDYCSDLLLDCTESEIVTTSSTTGALMPAWIDYGTAVRKMSWPTATDAWRVYSIPAKVPDICIKFKDGNRMLVVKKAYAEAIEITQEDVDAAKADWWKEARISVLEYKAEKKAEKLLAGFISELDFRNYKEKGFFVLRQGGKVYKIWRDTHKWIETYRVEEDTGFLVPENQLCVHTPKRELPLADEALAKVMLIRSNMVLERATVHSVASHMRRVEKAELLLV